MGQKARRTPTAQHTPAATSGGQQTTETSNQGLAAAMASTDLETPMPPPDTLPTPDQLEAIPDAQRRTAPESAPAEIAVEDQDQEMTGIGATASVTRFIQAAQGIQARWPDMSSSQRLQTLGRAANAELRSIDAYPVTKYRFGAFSQGNGMFTRRLWTVELSEADFAHPDIDDDEVAQSVAEPLYHEARHAEQDHRVARLRAGQGQGTTDIVRVMGIPMDVARDATRKPISPDDARETTEGQEATAWNRSVYGEESNARRQAFQDMMSTWSNLQLAEQAWRQASGTNVQAYLTAYQHAREAYRLARDLYAQLVEEVDARKVGERVRTLWPATTPAPNA